MEYEYLVVCSGLGILIELLICTSVFVKNLYYDGENELLLRFPVNGNQIFATKAILTYIIGLTASLFFVYPMYIVYGIITSAPAIHYVTTFLLLPLVTLLPFSIACLIALPVINITNLIKNRFALLLALMIIIVVASFAVYMILLKGVLEYAQSSTTSLLSEGTRDYIRNIASSLIPFNYYANVIYGEFDLGSLFILIAITLAVSAIAFLVSKRTVYPIVLKSIERESEAMEIKPIDKVRPVFSALLRKEYVLIFRSLNYSFQYLSMAITAPIMVFFCNDLASTIGDSSVGGSIIPGLTMLVVIIFITIIVSFASTAISREGNTFYLTKIMPVPYRHQILIKLILYFVVSSASVLVSCIIVWIAFGGEKYGNHVQFVDIISIFGIAELIIITLSAMAIKSDMKTPTFEVSKSGELVNANKNVSINMLTGVLIAVLFGLFTMIFSYLPLTIAGLPIVSNNKQVYVLLLIIASIFASLSLFSLFFRIDKHYNKIKEI
jgi:ABC-2 type transport system permease protein